VADAVTKALQVLNEALQLDPEAAQKQIQGVQRLRKERDDSQVQAALKRLTVVAQGSDNTVPAILECVESYCTLGEISQVFRDVFGEQEQMASF
jgi:methylmalonyl-CoA mutase N-terminal domain/subunit